MIQTAVAARSRPPSTFFAPPAQRSSQARGRIAPSCTEPSFEFLAAQSPSTARRRLAAGGDNHSGTTLLPGAPGHPLLLRSLDLVQFFLHAGEETDAVCARGGEQWRLQKNSASESGSTRMAASRRPPGAAPDETFSNDRARLRGELRRALEYVASTCRTPGSTVASLRGSVDAPCWATPRQNEVRGTADVDVRGPARASVSPVTVDRQESQVDRAVRARLEVWRDEAPHPPAIRSR